MGLNKDKAEKHQKFHKLEKMFKKFPKVLVVYLFGSRAKEKVQPLHLLSDFDFAILTEEILSLDERASLIGEITSVLETDQIDVVFLNQTKTSSLKFRIISEGKVLYCIDEKKRIKFEEKVIGEYQLLKPFLDDYDKHFLEEVKGYERRQS